LCGLVHKIKFTKMGLFEDVDISFCCAHRPRPLFPPQNCSSPPKKDLPPLNDPFGGSRKHKVGGHLEGLGKKNCRKKTRIFAQKNLYLFRIKIFRAKQNSKLFTKGCLSNFSKKTRKEKSQILFSLLHLRLHLSTGCSWMHSKGVWGLERGAGGGGRGGGEGRWRGKMKLGRKKAMASIVTPNPMRSSVL